MDLHVENYQAKTAIKGKNGHSEGLAGAKC